VDRITSRLSGTIQLEAPERRALSECERGKLHCFEGATLKIADNVKSCFEDALSGKFDAAMLHACIAIDATSKLLYPKQGKVGKRFTQTIRDYYWLVEPTLGAGINFAETIFSNVKLPKNDAPDFADIVYEVFRCGHVHGDEVPENFRVVPTEIDRTSMYIFGKDTVRFPDLIVWSLISIAVFSRVNARQKVQPVGPYGLRIGDSEFHVEEWWGREDEVRPIANKHNQVKISNEYMQRMLNAPDDGTGMQYVVLQPEVPDHVLDSVEKKFGIHLPRSNT